MHSSFSFSFFFFPSFSIQFPLSTHNLVFLGPVGCSTVRDKGEEEEEEEEKKQVATDRRRKIMTGLIDWKKTMFDSAKGGGGTTYPTQPQRCPAAKQAS